MEGEEMQGVRTQRAPEDDTVEAILSGPDLATPTEAMRDALREEFQALQGKLLEAVRLELAEVSMLRQPKPGPPFAKRSHSNCSTVSAKTPEHRYLPMKPYKVTEYKKWLEEVDEVVDQGLPTPCHDTDDEDFHHNRSVALSSTGKSVQVSSTGKSAPSEQKRKDLSEDTREADDLKCAAGAVASWGSERPTMPMAPHPWAPQHEDSDNPELPTAAPQGSKQTPSDALAHAATSAVSERQVHRAKQGLIQRVERIVRNPRFEMLSMAVIFGSALHIGWQTDHMARHGVLTPPTVFRVFDIAFLIFFVVELLLRLVVYRLRYFHMWGWHWNVLDLGLVLMQIMEEVVHAVDSDASSAFSSQLLRIVRILRAVRVIRIVHAMKFAEELRLLVNCVAHSSRSFHWAAALIALMVYVMGVHITQVALVETLEDSPSKDELMRWYGNVPRAVLSLFQGLTGGVDWNDLVEPLVSISPWFGLLFVLYMAFAIIAVMNVVTGTFVQQAMERAEHMNEVRKVSQASHLFRTLDAQREGFITFREIETHMESPAVRDFFQSIDLDISEAKCLFDMLDCDNSGKIDFEEFLGGCMRLQGSAKTIDLVMFMREMKDELRRIHPESA